MDNLFRLDVTKGTNLIFYISNDLKIERYFKPTDKLNNLKSHNLDIPENSDLVIKGLGFIKVTKELKGTLYINGQIRYSIRKSII